MNKIERKYQKIFGETGIIGPTGEGFIGPTGILGQFGSYKAGAIAYSDDTDILQALTYWGLGIEGSSINSSPPAIQDVNSIFYILTSMLQDLLFSGIHDYDFSNAIGMTYHKGSIIKYLYTSSNVTIDPYSIIAFSNKDNVEAIEANNPSDSTSWVTILESGMDYIYIDTAGNYIINPCALTTVIGIDINVSNQTVYIYLPEPDEYTINKIHKFILTDSHVGQGTHLIFRTSNSALIDSATSLDMRKYEGTSYVFYPNSGISFISNGVKWISLNRWG